MSDQKVTDTKLEDDIPTYDGYSIYVLLFSTSTPAVFNIKVND